MSQAAAQHSARASEVVEAGDVLDHRRHRPFVQPQLGVGEVLVVEQQHVGGAHAGQLRCSSVALAVDVDLDPLAAHQLRAVGRSYRPTPMRWVRSVG